MKKKAGFFTREEDYRYRKAEETLEKWLGLIRSEDNGDGVQVFERLKALFQEKQDEYHNSFEQTSLKLEHAFDFMEAVFPERPGAGGLYFRIEQKREWSSLSGRVFL